MSIYESIIALQQSRFALIQEATELEFNDDMIQVSRQLIITRLELLEQNWTKFRDEHENLCHSFDASMSNHSYIKSRIFERCQAFYVYSKAKLLTHRDDMESSERPSGSLPSDHGINTLLPRSALPRIGLPNFSGEYQSWRSFHDLFSSLIRENSDLSSVEKMHYLKTCLTGEAARLISNIPLSGENFIIAWEMLVSRFENKRFLITAQLDRLTNLKPLKSKSAHGLNTFLTTITECIGALRVLGCAVHYWDLLLLHQLVRLLDPESREAWEMRLGSSSSYPTFKFFEEFLIGRARAMENLNFHTSSTNIIKERQISLTGGSHSRVSAYVTTSSSTQDSSKCPLCGATHYIAKCFNYQGKTTQQRYEALKKHRRCYNCLGSHTAKECVSTKRCLKCGRKHHTTIHNVLTGLSSNQRRVEMTQTNKKRVNVHQSSQEHPSRTHTLLATGRVLLERSQDDLQFVRLLIDPGSELSFISEDLVQRLKLNRTAASLPLLGIGGTYSGRTKGIVTIRLRSIHVSTSSCSITAYVLSRLTTKLPPFDTHCSWSHINGLQLADPDFSRAGPIHIILGADYYGSIIMPGLIRGDSSTPIAQQTIFGWALSGPINLNEISQPTYVHHCTLDHDLQKIISRFWTQEEITTLKNSSLTPEEEECEQYFLSTHSRDSSGRYIVRLPLKSNHTFLGNSKARALGSLRTLTKRFSSDPRYRKLYIDFIEEYKILGHMILTKEDDKGRTVFYLPHHGVLREQSTTTKLRVVFNGSSPTSNGKSLNDILYPGAKLQKDISEILLWIRTHRVLFCTDIVKMFRQIAIHRDDWNLQRILWFDQNGQPVDYCLTTVTYGLNCAPFLALRTLQQLIQDEGQRFPKAVTPMTKGRYVDDIFGGADSISEAKETVQQLISFCKAGGFPLQKWNSNYKEILPQDKSTENNTSTVEIESTLHKILGLVWQPTSDTFHFSPQLSTITTFTKRSISSEIAKLFDPLGLISPILIRAKLILQELWLLKIDWDDPLPPEIIQKWTTFRNNLQEIDQLSIPRWIGHIGTKAKIEVHGFSDASNLAIAAAIYIRVHLENDDYSVRLLCSKTKVAPLKRLTISRLELTAALLMTRLVAHTVKALELTTVSIVLWTDSSVSLTWITSHPSRWKDFIRNRTSQIQEILPSATWRFVPGKDNPADCASRGLRPDQLLQHKLWWNGPIWLSQSRLTWPSTGKGPATDADIEERPGQSMVALVQRSSYWILLDKYSSIMKLLRITSICRRFISCLRRVPQSSLNNPILPAEIDQSRFLWVRIVQQAWFSLEIKILSQGDPLPRSNSLIMLIPFIDQQGILRVGGRLHHAQIDTESKHPPILPRRSPLTTLIIADAHQRTLHGGTQVTQALIRRSYWIIGGRAIRSYILKCVRCARFRGTRAKQLMGQLPSPRVTPSRPFLNTGLDYAGPVTLKTWRGRAARLYKGYIAIFVCLVTSAVHLEIVTDYSTEAFIAAYKRFTGRRGICATLQSDCGTNFVGADAALRHRFESSSKELIHLASLLANDGTKWIFNPPAAPHFGGKWEAAVKSTKFHLHRLLGDITLTYEEMTTIIIQIEAVLNSRPLCPLSDDINDYSALTPGHFLIGEPPITIPEPDLTSVPISRLSRWQLLKQKVDHFWSRWLDECLQRYQAISKWHHPKNEVKEGSLVLITDETYPPSKWPLARVIQRHPGPDGLTRVVTLRIVYSTLKRPIAKVCVLPIDTDTEDSTILLSKAGGNVTETLTT